MTEPQTDRSDVLPTDIFDRALANLTDRPGAVATQATALQHQDWYGNVTSYMVQTVRWEDGCTTFVTQVNAEESKRYILPPRVLALMDRQRDSISLTLRRRHGKRLAEQRKADGTMPVFTPEMRAKGLATRKKKAQARKQRKARKGGVK